MMHGAGEAEVNLERTWSAADGRIARIVRTDMDCVVHAQMYVSFVEL